MMPYRVTRDQWVNSSPPGATFMHQWTGSALGQVMAWCRRGDKPLPELMVAYCELGLLGTIFSEIWIGILSFSFKKIHLKLSSANTAAILSRGRWVKELFAHRASSKAGNEQHRNHSSRRRLYLYNRQGNDNDQSNITIHTDCKGLLSSHGGENNWLSLFKFLLIVELVGITNEFIRLSVHFSQHSVTPKHMFCI